MTTLGAHLALAMDVPHADVDDYYWQPTDPSYREKRTVDERLALMKAMFLGCEGWVLSGSIMNWGNPLIHHFDLAIQLVLDPKARMARLLEREQRAYGDKLAVPGEYRDAHNEFMAWAAGYDDPGFKGRSKAKHDAWAAELPCAVIALNASYPVEKLTKLALENLN